MSNVITYRVARMHHQKVGERRAFLEYLRCRNLGTRFGFGLFFSPGTGKSYTAINIARRIQMFAGHQHRIMILGPAIVSYNWREEFKKFSDLDLKRIHILHGSTKKCGKVMRAAGFDHLGRPLPGVFITNYDKLPVSHELCDIIRSWKPDILICDESHRLKDGTAKRTKIVDSIANPFSPPGKPPVLRPGVLLLSGTPVLNTPMDAHSQFKILDGGDSLGENFYVFRGRFFTNKNANWRSQRAFPRWILKPGAVEQIRDIVQRKSMSIALEDCFDLPPLIKQSIKVPMGAAQAKHYQEMKQQLITYIDGEACVAQIALTKALRLMEIASGFLKTEDGNVISFPDNPKLSALGDIFEDVAPVRKIIVWAVFRENYRMIRELLGKKKIKYVEIHGDSGGHKQKKEAEDAFQKDPSVRVLLGHPGSGGIGVNLTAGSYTVFYSSTFSREHREQSQARNYRKGSEVHSSITHVDLLCSDTIEEDVLKKLDEKKEIGLAILQNLV